MRLIHGTLEGVQVQAKIQSFDEVYDYLEGYESQLDSFHVQSPSQLRKRSLTFDRRTLRKTFPSDLERSKSIHFFCNY